MAKVLYGTLKIDGEVYKPGTKVSGLPAGVQKVIRDQKILTVDESVHPFTKKKVEPEDWEIEEDDQDEDEE